ncbi:hypothetical protein, partial [Bilophila wadsworthia]|uniref:hypothetical protein n=1 Tax=Bilophila wadsworthia TaxID=35833 RepID=UPI003AB5F39A
KSHKECSPKNTNKIFFRNFHTGYLSYGYFLRFFLYFWPVALVLYECVQEPILQIHEQLYSLHKTKAVGKHYAVYGHFPPFQGKNGKQQTESRILCRP